MTAPKLPSRYEIRVLTRDHLDWAAGILSHSNIFYSPLWPVILPENKTKRFYEFIKMSTHFIGHQIDSGFSFGVFDTEYKFKRDESAVIGGKAYWDFSNEDADANMLLEQMDFPLVSIALAYDGANVIDPAELAGVMKTLPQFATLYQALAEIDGRDPESWKPKGPREVLMRNGTSTRHEYERQGLMKQLAHYQMHKAAKNGFRGIQIEAAADAVTHVWAHPPEPYYSDVVAAFDSYDYTKEKDGEMVKPFFPACQRITKVYCNLK